MPPTLRVQSIVERIDAGASLLDRHSARLHSQNRFSHPSKTPLQTHSEVIHESKPCQVDSQNCHSLHAQKSHVHAGNNHYWKKEHITTKDNKEGRWEDLEGERGKEMMELH